MSRTTLSILSELVGQTCLTADEIYIHDINVRLAVGIHVLVLRVIIPEYEGTISVTAWANETDRPNKMQMTDDNPVIGAELLYPDGQARWTWLVMGQDGYQDSLVQA